MPNNVISTPIVVATGASVSLIEGATYTCPEKSGNGGAVENNGGMVTGNSVQLAGNTASDKGGAVFNAGIITLNNATFTANRTTEYMGCGGAIYNSFGSLTISGDAEFTGNSVYLAGGAIDNDGGTVTLKNAVFSGNTAGDGGAIDNDGGTVTLKNAVFSGNTAGDGGAILNRDGITAATFDFTDASVIFSGNTAELYGGAIYNYSIAFAATLDFTGSSVSFSDNTAGIFGGAIYNNDVLNFTDSSVSFCDNSAHSYGGAIYNHGGTTSATLDFTGSSVSFSDNTARFGGAICNQKGAANFTTSNVTFSGNNVFFVGGAIYNLETVNFTGSSVSFTDNFGYDGGAIYSGGVVNFTDSNVSFSGNSASNDIDGCGGGAICNYNASFTATLDFTGSSVTFSDNSGYDGGAIYSGGVVNFTDSNVSFSGNSGYDGGAIYNHGGTTSAMLDFTDSNVSFSCNTASNDGGAICNDGGSATVKFTGSSVTFSSNTAKDGGAICNQRTMTFSDASVSFIGNRASYGAGAIINYSGTASATLDFTGSSVSFSGNTGYACGALYNGNTLDFTDSSVSFSGNVSGFYGGAIYNQDGTVNFSGSTANVSFTGNSATTYGGAIYNEGTVTVSNNASFTGNRSDSGGAIFSTGTVNFSGSSVNFTSNSARMQGGAIINEGGTVDFAAASVSFTGNSSTNAYGGAICNLGTVNFSGASVTFSGNAAKNGGGAIHNDGGTVNLKGIMTLATTSDTVVNTGTFNWDLTGGTASHASVAGYERVSNSGTLALTVTAEQELGEYVIASGSLAGLAQDVQTFTLTGIGAATQTISVGDSMKAYGGLYFSLANVGDEKLVLTVTSEKPSIADASLTVTGEYIYNGQAQEAAVTVVLGSKTLAPGIDYTLSYQNNVNAGNATVTVTGINDYTGTQEKAFTIDPKALTVVGTAADGKTYDGNTNAVIGTVGTLTGVISGDDVTIGTATGTFSDKDADNGKNVTITYTLAGVKAANYTVGSSVTIADIEKRSVTLTSATDFKSYDGTPLTNDTVIVSGDGWISGEGATCNVTGSQTAIGSSKNTFTYTLDANTKAGNYDVVTVEGDLTVLPRIVVSDYNGTGKSDMIQFVNGLVYVTHDTGSGYVQTPAINDITGWNVVEIRRDLTDDGFADIQITSDDGAGNTWVAALRNDYLKNGCITLNYQFIGAYNNELWSYLGSADFNGDGKAEILMVQTEAGKDQYGHRNVAAWVTDVTTCEWIDNIWLGALNDGWDIAGTADVTGDGKDNLILRGADGMIGYWAEFEGMPEDIVELKNAGNRVLVTTGDFDGDGAEDFLWQTIGGDEFSVWTDVNGEFNDTVIGKESDLEGNWSFAGVGDYNGDGKDEILWCDTTTYHTAYGEADKLNFKNLTVIV